MKRPRVALIALTAVVVVAVTAFLVSTYVQRSQLRRVRLGDASVLCYVADTPEEHSRGLQGYDELPPGRGMLFDFGGSSKVREFAMKTVSFPVDMVFIADTGRVARVVKVVTMMPGDETLVSSDVPVFAVIEVPAGWAEENDVEEGDECDLPLKGPSKYRKR